MESKKIKREIVDILVVLTASLMAALYLHVFVVPADFAPSGIAGLCMIFLK
jgi:uncharacterized membrane-anchored protein YitT (DUF2179 family)